jgi:predicted PurR-regulated permease PerM
MINSDKLPVLFFSIVFLFMLGFNGYLFHDMIHPLIFGAIMAGVFSPFKKRIMAKLNISKTWASLLTIIIMILFVIMPGIYIFLKISTESISIFHIVKLGLSKQAINDFFFGNGPGAELINKGSEFLGIQISTQQLEQKLLELLRMLSSYLLTFINSIFSNIFTFILNFVLMILTTFALLHEGDELKIFMLKLSPLPDEQEELIVNKFNQMNYVTLVCNGLGGLLQGFLAAIGLWIAGVSSIFLWFVVMVILAFIPLVGISVVTIPASLYFMLTGEVTKGITLFIYTTLISIVVENWFKAKFIGSRIQINGMLIFFYIIAGMSIFGMPGIFYGPLILSIFLTMVNLYHTHYYPQAPSL